MDLDTLAQAWRQRGARQRARRLERVAHARESARRAARILREEFEVAEVWLFGSLAGEPQHDDFDVDLAVRGLRPERYFEALARVSDVVREPIDLIPLEGCTERLQSRIATTGERLHDG